MLTNLKILYFLGEHYDGFVEMCSGLGKLKAFHASHQLEEEVLYRLPCSLIELSLDQDFTTEGLKILERFSELQDLAIHKPSTGTFNLNMSAFRKLTKLWIGRSSINDNDMKSFSCLKLESLHISDSEITNLGLQCLSGMTSLKTLRLPNAHISDLRSIRCLTLLVELNVSFCRITTDGLQPTSGLTSLQELNLYCNPMISKIDCISSLTNLRFLSLGDCQLVAESLSVLSLLVNCRIHK